jgi:hypothetical protein
VLNKAPAEGAYGYMYAYYGPSRHSRPELDGDDKGKRGLDAPSAKGEVAVDPVAERR